MNERMLELARQVWPDPNISHTNHMKFAELIVRECAVWMENATVTDSAGNKDHIGDSFFWADELKKHFGVE